MRISRLVLAAALALAAMPLAQAGSYAESHPDQYFRTRAAELVGKGKHAAAVEDFRRAARYGDKPSQLALALSYWNGEGVAVDRALGYVWADLAAERGVPAFVAVRERMWEQLSEAERASAVATGKTLAAEYADAVAQPRLERLLRRGSRQKTGSRTGSSVYSTGVASMDPGARAALAAEMYTSMMGNVGPGAGGGAGSGNQHAGAAEAHTYGGSMITLLGQAMRVAAGYSAAGYYDPENWDPKRYWKAQDAPWRDLPDGIVTVGPLAAERK